jgi:phosphocarrier protein
MVKREFRIGKALFKDARGAAQLVNLCSKLKSRIVLVIEGDYIDCRSILGLLQLRLFSGERFVVQCSGDDESEALALLVDFFVSGGNSPAN